MFADAAPFTMTSQLPIADFIFGSTPGMQEARDRLEAALQDDLPVLIEGESGTGKELVARYLHFRSDRAAGPFVRVNCGATWARSLDPETLTREWLDRGAEQAEALRATLFLDEIAEMHAAQRQEILLEFKTAKTGESSGKANARIVCASSFGLESGATGKTDGSLLADEFKHRVRLLPLRERKRDLPALCGYLLEKCARNFGRSIPQLGASVLDEFERWDWPGNVRELENWIARIVIFGTEAVGIDFGRHVGSRGGLDANRRHSIRLNLGRDRGARRHA